MISTDLFAAKSAFHAAHDDHHVAGTTAISLRGAATASERANVFAWFSRRISEHTVCPSPTRCTFAGCNGACRLPPAA